jgi:hypothetical protein
MTIEYFISDDRKYFLLTKGSEYFWNFCTFEEQFVVKEGDLILSLPACCQYQVMDVSQESMLLRKLMLYDFTDDSFERLIILGQTHYSTSPYRKIEVTYTDTEPIIIRTEW